MKRGLLIAVAALVGVVVVVSLLVRVFGSGGSSGTTPRPAAQSSEVTPPPPAPPPDAIVEARELGPYGVALAAEPMRLTALVLSPAGGGADGLDVRINGRATTRCGHGCYRVDERHGDRSRVSVGGLSGWIGSPLQSHATHGEAPLRSFVTFWHRLRSVVYVERLASDPTHAIVTRWRLESPNRLTYSIRGGAQAVVVGTRRWDRASPRARWLESPQTPALPQPALPWRRATNVWMVSVHDVVFVDPTIPAYFDLVAGEFPYELRMIAPAHFMTDRYLRFNAPRAIRPPR